MCCELARLAGAHVYLLPKSVAMRKLCMLEMLPMYGYDMRQVRVIFEVNVFSLFLNMNFEVLQRNNAFAC